MTLSEQFVMELFDIAGEDRIAVEGKCQHCKCDVRLELDLVGREIECRGNGGLRYYAGSPKPVFLCESCKERGKRVGAPCEVYSRVVGYLSPVNRWNLGKKLEFKLRTPFDVDVKPDVTAA